VKGFAPALDRLAVREISARFLTQDGRIELADLRQAGLTIRQIADQMGQAPSTISRELRRNACAGRKLGYRFWPGLSCGGPVLVGQSAQTLSASDLVGSGRERDHVRFVFGSSQKHSVALVAAPGVVMGDVDVEHVV
jgi:hypothetical protein